MNVKLYDMKMAPNRRRARMFLAEKGIEIEKVDVNIMTQEAQTPEFTAKNPMQRIPMLELDDGTCISETMAISRYFEEVQPEPPLMGIDAKDKAIVEMWNRRVELGLLQAVTMAFRHTNSAMAHLEVPQMPEWGELNRPKIENALKMLDTRLGTSRFIAGERFSVADITAVCTIDFAKVIGRRLGEDTPNLQRWHAEVAARASYKA